MLRLGFSLNCKCYGLCRHILMGLLAESMKELKMARKGGKSEKLSQKDERGWILIKRPNN